MSDISKPYGDQSPFDGKTLHPMDKVILKDGREATVNSAHYISNDGRQKFSICRDPDVDALYFSDESTFVHRCNYVLKGFAYVCECGAIYTTMADHIRLARNSTELN